MPISKKKWFCEDKVPGRRFGKIKHCFKIDKLVFQGKTPCQDALIFDNSVYGRVFCLENIVEFSQKDEFIYHEMISHPVLFSHPDPKNVLIIGGGDGGALREVLKHPVERVDLVELDKEVINLSKKYLSFVCQNAFSDKRVNIFNMPGQEFIAKRDNFYDIAIIDCTNFGSDGLSNPLYSEGFYEQLLKSMSSSGILIALGFSFLDFDNLTRSSLLKLNKFFPFVSVLKFCMPSYHCGEYSFITASKKINPQKPDFLKINRRFKKLERKFDFKYYSPEVHKASLVLPKVWKIRKEKF
jgi:spermidine synthase